MAGNGTRTLKVVIVGNAASAKKALAEAGAAAEATGVEANALGSKWSRLGATMTKFGKAGSLAAAGIAAASIDLGVKFQDATTRIHTQANVSIADTAKLSQGFLDLAGKVGETPTVLADAGYHIASIGQNSLTTAQQLRILKVAAEGAKIGGADLTDVTNALDAAVVSHIKGVKNYSQAMGVLNSTVGAGDMSMQDMADAFGPLGAVMKGYNVDIKQVGAALATFGDNNVRGAQAGTQLRMSVQSLAVPTRAGSALLQEWGISAGNLSKQLEHGGLTEALDTLMAKMRANGVTAEEQGDVLTQAFGKKAGTGLNVLMGELDRYHNKLGEVSKGAGSFASSWAAYSKTLSSNFAKAKDGAEALLTSLGLKLLPAASAFMAFVAQTLIPGIGKLGSILQGAATQVVGFFSSLGGGNSSGGAGQAVATIEGAFGSLKSFLGNVFASISGYYDKHQAQIQALADKARVVLTQLGTMFSAAFAAIAAVVEVGFKVVSVLWDTFGATILGFLTDTVGNLETVFGGLFKTLQGVFDVFAGIFSGDWARVWKGLGEIFGGVWDAIRGVLKEALAVIKAALSAALDAISALWSKAWDGIKAVFVGVWHGIREVLSGDWQAIKSLIVQPVSDGVGHIKDWFDKLVGFVASLPGKIGHAASGAFDGLWNAFKDSVDHIIDGWNSLSFTLPKVNTHIPGVGTIGGWTISTPDIPRLAVGGTIDTAGLALVGERGPELVSLPSGATVYPNSSPQTRGALGRGVTVHANVNFNVEGSVDESVLPIIDARIDTAFAQLVQEIEAGLEG